MYRLNPLVDINTPVTPAQLMYRLENIHAHLQTINAGTTGADVAVTNSLFLKPVKQEPLATKNNNVKTTAVSAPSKSPEKKLKSPTTPKQKNVVAATAATTVDDLFKLLDDRIASLKQLQTGVDAHLLSPHTVDAVVCKTSICRPYGRRLSLTSPGDKMWPLDKTLLKFADTIRKASTNSNQIRLLVTVPLADGIASWLPCALQLLRARHNCALHVTQHVHSSVRARNVHDVPLLDLAGDENAAGIVVKVIVRDASLGGCIELLVDHWPGNKHTVFVGANAADVIFKLAGVPSLATATQFELAERLITGQSSAVNELHALLSTVAASAKNKKAPVFVTGDSSTILDLVAACALRSSFTQLKLPPLVNAWLDSCVQLV